ncbi:MAG: ABC transporter ATP-binding protein [Nevskiales bacterium]
MTVLLEAKALAVDLGPREILHGVSLRLAAGEVLGLLGPNGAGKTTLLRALAGLIPSARGEIRLGRAPLAGISPRQRARRLAYLAQGRECHWPLAVADLVALGRLPFRAPWARVPDADRAAIEQALRDAGVQQLAQQPITSLSGGERARALLARALASTPEVLLADEPTAGLDPAHQLKVMGILRERAAQGAGVLVVLHDLSLAARYCDRLLLLHQGRVLAVGTPAEVLTPAHLAESYGIEAHYAQTGQGLVVVPLNQAPRPPSR